MNTSLLPVSLPTRHGFVARTLARVAPLVLIAGLAVWWIGRSGNRGTGQARGFAESVPLTVASSSAGRVVEVLVSVGQAVKAGDPIARLDPQPLELQRRRLEAERALLAAKLVAESSRQGDSVMRAEVWRLRTAAEAQQDKAALVDLENEVTRLDGLLDDQLVKASDVAPRRQDRDALAARVGTFERARAAGHAALDLKKGAEADHHAEIELRTAPLREALRVKEIRLQQLALQTAALTLRAPGQGVVGAINRRPGEMLAAGEAAVLIVAHRPGLFEIYLSDRDQRLPRVGASAHLTRSGLFTRPVTGRVIEVSPAIVELPPRLRLTPQIPTWGRRVLVDASPSPEMRALPAGEEVRVRL
jgi:HlyD family secretion protein